MSNNNNILPMLEWEALASPMTLDSIDEIGGIHSGVTSVELVRNDRYEIIAHLNGISAIIGMGDDAHNRRSGESTPSSRVVGRIKNAIRVTLDPIYEGDISIRGDGLLTGDAIVYNAKFTMDHEGDPSWVALWCLNGPRTLFPSRSTDRESSHQITRVRRGTGGTDTDHIIDIIASESKGFANDYWLVNNNAFTARLCRVPDSLGPEWSKNYVVEVDRPDKSLLFPTDYEYIFESISYVLGKKLIPIGLTAYSASGYWQYQEICTPSSTGLHQRCMNAEMPPVPFKNKFFLEENLLNVLTEQYCSVRDEFDLKKAMIHYWQSDVVTLEESLASLASCLQTIIRAWFRSKRTKTRGKYLSDEEWTESISVLLPQLEAALHGRDYSDRILRKVLQANEMSMNEQYEQFFKEIGLVVDSYEDSVLKARHRFAHGAIADTSEYDLLAEASHAYRTLINRVLLCLFGYTGEYIDYSTYDFPSRKMTEPMGGAEGDRKILKF